MSEDKSADSQPTPLTDLAKKLPEFKSNVPIETANRPFENFEITKTTLIGRLDPAAKEKQQGIVIEGVKYLSRKGLRLEKKEDGWHVLNDGSTNPVYRETRDGEKSEISNDYMAEPGDVYKIGVVEGKNGKKLAETIFKTNPMGSSLLLSIRTNRSGSKIAMNK